MIRRIIVNHEPIGQPRHRMSTRGGFAKMYLPASHPVHGFKDSIRLAFGRRNPQDGPVKVSIVAWFARPKAMIWKRKKMVSYPHTGKPDIDNVVKAVFDALNGFAWHDDAQVCSLAAEKWVCGGDDSPGVEITIETMKRGE